jgi:hypothetical protein
MREEHDEHLRLILQCLREKKLYGRISTCYFYRKEIDYLGHIISGEGIIMDPVKVGAIMKWETLTNVQELHIFMFSAAYYRWFVESFLKIANPITELQKKKNKFVWNDKCTKSFQKIKEFLTTTLMLKVPDMEKELLLCTDASKEGLGRFLMQDNRVIACISRKLRKNEEKYTTQNFVMRKSLYGMR